MITLDRVTTRRAPFALDGFSATWGAGVHAIVGAPTDGGPLLLLLLAGRERARGGRVTVLGGAPTDASVRPCVAFVPRDPPLPEVLRVEEALAMAAALRGDPPVDAGARLAVLGVEALAQRPVRTLSRPEARAVALAEALTSSRVRVLLVDEPLVAMDPRAVGRIPEALRARARDGTAVVVATSSTRDASELAEDRVLLGAAPAPSSGGACVRVVVRSDVRPIVVSLASAPGVDRIEHDGAAVVARGPEASVVAGAIGRAVVETAADVIEIAPEARAAPAERTS